MAFSWAIVSPIRRDLLIPFFRLVKPGNAHWRFFTYREPGSGFEGPIYAPLWIVTRPYLRQSSLIPLPNWQRIVWSPSDKA